MNEVNFDSLIKRASLFNIVVAAALFLIKFQAYRITGSQAIFSEAMESTANVLAAIVGFYVLYFASQPADKEHPYGHGKIEYLSAALEGGLIAFAAFLIVVEAIQAVYESRNIVALDLGMALLAGTAVVNVALGLYLNRVGKRKGSLALEASGRHLMADFWTTAGVLVGLSLVIVTGIQWIDVVLAFLVSIHLVKEGYELVRKAIAGLLDEEQESVIRSIQSLINEHKQEGIIQVHHLRVIRSGRYHHMDAHVVVPEFWSVEVAHDNTNKYEKTIFKNYQFSGEIHFHVDPCRRLYCQFCDLKDCPVRIEPFQGFRNMSLEELTDADEPSEIVEKIDENP